MFDVDAFKKVFEMSRLKLDFTVLIDEFVLHGLPHTANS